MKAAKIATIVKRYGRKPTQIISMLQDVQAEDRYLSEDALTKLAKKLNLSLSQVYSLATFYRAFSLKRRGEHMINVCMGTACHVRGAARILEEIERRLGVKPGETTEDNKFSLETVNCLGACALGPVVVVDGKYNGQMSVAKVAPLLKKYSSGKSMR